MPDDLSDVSCKDSTRQHPADDPLLSCNLLLAPLLTPLDYVVCHLPGGWNGADRELLARL